MSVDNKKTLLVLILLCLAFFVYNRPKAIDVVPIDNPVVIIPEPPNPAPPENNGCDLSLTEALKINKQLLIIFVADWCGFCKSLKNDLPHMKDIDRYVLCLANVDDESNKDLIKHFGIKMLPTAILVDPKENKEIKRISGYEKTKFLSWMR